MSGEIIGFAAVVLIFGVPIVKIWTDHQRKVLEMKLQLRNQGDTGLRTEFEALRQEVRSLRDTCTQYDLSFDSALQRMEQRMGRIESGAASVQADQQARVGIGS